MPATVAPTMRSEKTRTTEVKLKGSRTNGMAVVVAVHSSCSGRRPPAMIQGSRPRTAPAAPAGRA